MATNYWTNAAKASLLSSLSGLKWMLVADTYTPDKDHVYVSEATAHEINCAGYVPGYAGPGRATVNFTGAASDNSTDRGSVSVVPVVFTTIGVAGSGPTVGYALLIEETGGSDATSLIKAVFDCQIELNGQNFTVSANALGLLGLA